MLYTYLRKSKAYFDGTRVLIDGGKTFRDFIRANKDSQRLIKKLIKDVSGTRCPLVPTNQRPRQNGLQRRAVASCTGKAGVGCVH